ncbi:type 1 glutamine amidotransferase domain-containing protein, partial [Staphylococcus pseudintermedius]
MKKTKDVFKMKKIMIVNTSYDQFDGFD